LFWKGNEKERESRGKKQGRRGGNKDTQTSQKNKEWLFRADFLEMIVRVLTCAKV